MRRLLLIPALLLLTACGAPKLSRSEAERDIRADYPVAIPVAIPARQSAEKGSAAHNRLLAAHEALARYAWVKSSRKVEGSQDVFTFTLAPNPPKSVQVTPQGFEVLVAQAEFAGARAMRPEGRDMARVTYAIRLAKPTEFFPLFQALHPKATLGSTKERHALYKREGRRWVLQKTDESFTKKEGGLFGFFD